MTQKHEIIKTLAKMAPVTCGDLAVQGAVVEADNGEWEAV